MMEDHSHVHVVVFEPLYVLYILLINIQCIIVQKACLLV